MSEADAESRSGRDEIWIEKYRPQTLEDIVGQEQIVERLQSYVARDDLPHLMFSGSAGIGKCVTGDTPVLTGDGLARIEEVVGDVDGFSTAGDDLQVLTFTDDGEFEYVSPSHVFGKRTDELVSIATRDGSSMRVTPEHKLLVLRNSGLDWIDAAEVEAGDRVVRPLRAPLPDTDERIDWLSAMNGDRTFVHVSEEFARRHEIPTEENHVGKKKAAIKRLRKGHDVATVADAVSVPKSTVKQYRNSVDDGDLHGHSTTCSLSYLRDLDAPRSELREHVQQIQWVAENGRRSRPVTPPWSVTPRLARFIGLAISEARIDGGRIKFYNRDDGLLDQFETAAESAFAVELQRGEQNGTPHVEIGSKTLTHYLESSFDVFDSAAGGTAIGSQMLQASEESRAAFLRAVFDAEGHVTPQGIVELTQRNEDIITLLSYLLAGFGIPSRRTTDWKAATNGSGTEREYHTLFVSGATNLERFAEEVGFTLETKRDRLHRNAERDENPNHDTIPVQDAVSTLCAELALPKSDLLTKTLNPETPGRENYLRDVDAVVDAATAKLETAQEVRQRVRMLQSEIETIGRVPATWVGERSDLEPLSVRDDLSAETGLRKDRLLEYADGRRTPTARRTEQLLVERDRLDAVPSVERVQSELQTAVERLNVRYSHVVSDTHLSGRDAIKLLETDDHDLRSLPRFETVADGIEAAASAMLSADVLGPLRELNLLTTSNLYYDEVESVERTDADERVYDLTVPESRNYVAGQVPTVMHNTTSAQAVARDLYGEDWQEHFLELNASDQRGIDVVRERIKSFARSSFGGHDYRIIFLDEADSLTSDAQSALRRTMEQFSNNVRFILSCNYSSQIIDPIQSRCAVFRFAPLSDEAVDEQVRIIADEEGIELTDDGVDALVYAAGGDMRKAINGLQAAAVTGDVVDEEAVYAITSTARPEEIHEMVTSALDGDFLAARSKLDDLLTEEGIAGNDVIDQLHRSVWEFELDDEAAVTLLDRIGEADYRITEGANERIQLEALLASLALDE